MTLLVRGLTKRYGATLALDDVDLDVAAGEVHALLGHNGAGKSTVIGCLGGRTAPTAGTMVLDGVEHASLDPKASIAAGVAIIYQHLSLIEGLSVVENLVLGQEQTRGGVLRKAAHHEHALAALARIGADIPPDVVVRELSTGQKQQVEIAKAVSRDARLLVLDEPTAALSPADSDRLASLVERLRSEGLAILYVTHLLSEVVRLADRATVLRDGRVVWSSAMAGVTKANLVAAVSGGADHTASPEPPASSAGTPPALEVQDLVAPGLSPISLTVAPGEVVALYGLVGSGRTRLLETLFGVRLRTSGTVRVNSAAVDPRNPDQALAAGIALVPGDRATQGLFPALTVQENVVTRAMSRWSRWGLRDRAAERRTFNGVARGFSLRPADPGLPVRGLSGGNQQKALIGRWVNDCARVRVLLLDDPTQGVDVGARAEIYDVVHQTAAREGVGVLVATNDPDEVLALAHRCLVIDKGRVVEELDVRTTTEEQLLERIHGDEYPRSAGSPPASAAPQEIAS